MAMSRMAKYLMFLIVVIMLFHFAGLIQDTGTSYLLNNLGITNPENFGSTTFYLTIVALGTLGVTGAIVIGTLGRVSAESAAMLTIGVPLAAVMLLIGWDMIALFNVLRQSNMYIASLIISPLFIVYILTIYDWYMGRD